MFKSCVNSFDFFVNLSGIWCLESSREDWLPSDVTIGLCPGRSRLWFVCQQRKAGGNRPQGQKNWCRVGTIFVQLLYDGYPLYIFFPLLLIVQIRNWNILPRLSLTNFFSFTPSTHVYSVNLNGDKSFEMVWKCFFGASQGKEWFAVAKQHSFVLVQYPALCLTAQLVLICDHRLQNELTVLQLFQVRIFCFSGKCFFAG